MISDLKTQVFREGQTRPWDYEIRILREKSCRHVLWEVSTTPWASITSHFTLFIELWNAGRPEHRLVQILTRSLLDPYRIWHFVSTGFGLERDSWSLGWFRRFCRDHHESRSKPKPIQNRRRESSHETGGISKYTSPYGNKKPLGWVSISIS